MPVLENWVDSRFGPIRYVAGMSVKPPEPAWWIYDCRLSRPIGDWFNDNATIAMGASIDGSDALRRALGEAIERYNCLNSMNFAESVQMPLAGNPIVDMLPLCADFEPCTSTFKRMPKTVPITQVKMRRLSNDTEAWMPAGFVHLNFSPKPPEPLLTLPITSGLAFHSDLLTAIWSGLLEYAERDAVMTCWWLRRAKRIVIDEADVEDALAERLMRMRRAGLEPFLFDISTDFRVPCVFCVLRSDIRPYYTVGAACHADAAFACVKALDEAMCIRIVQKEFGKTRTFPSLTEFDWLKSLEDRADLFAQWKGSPALDFLFAEKQATTSLDEIGQQIWWTAPSNMAELSQFAKLMEERDLIPFWSDTTIDDVRDLGHCIKVVVP